MFRKVFVLALGLMALTSTAVASAPPADGARDNVGNEKWAVLLCRFADSPTAKPFPVADYDAAFNTADKSHRRFFKQSSYGQLMISADVYSWRKIKDRSFYPGDYLSHGEAFLHDLFRACTKKHDDRVDFSQYEGVIMFFDDRELDISDGTACGFGDTCTDDRTIGVSGYAWSDLRIKKMDGHRGWRTVWMATHGSAHNEVTAHEISHTYGAPHSAAGADDAFDDECFPVGPPACGHPWDLMASSWLGIPPDSHTLAATKVFHHGWISGARRCNVTTDGTETFELERLALARDNDRCLAITILQPGTTDAWYVVEARFRKGFDADSSDAFPGGGIPGPAVLISRICFEEPFCTQEPMVVGRDISPQDGQIDEGSAEWQAGETFVNFNGQITIEILSRGTGFYTVRVTRDSSP